MFSKVLEKKIPTSQSCKFPQVGICICLVAHYNWRIQGGQTTACDNSRMYCDWLYTDCFSDVSNNIEITSKPSKLHLYVGTVNVGR